MFADCESLGDNGTGLSDQVWATTKVVIGDPNPVPSDHPGLIQAGAAGNGVACVPDGSEGQLFREFQLNSVLPISTA